MTCRGEPSYWIQWFRLGADRVGSCDERATAGRLRVGVSIGSLRRHALRKAVGGGRAGGNAMSNSRQAGLSRELLGALGRSNERRLVISTYRSTINLV